jgi:hypothetical protein
MPVPLFTGQVIAVIWDFDQTLIPGYQQEPLFRAYGVDAKVFWNEVNRLAATNSRRQGCANSIHDCGPRTPDAA